MKNRKAKLAIIFAALAMGLGIQAHAEQYPTTFKVEAVDYENNTVTLDTGWGIKYQVHGAEDYAVGDYISAIMDTNGTDLIADDTIVTMRYTGCTGYGIF